MAERRTVAKKISVSEQVNSLSSDFVRLLFTWMILHADDYGVLSGSAWSIRSLVIPMLDRTNAEVEAALVELDESGLVWRYSGPDKKPYVQFRTWEAHQSGLHKRTQPHLPLFYDPRNSDESESPAPEIPGDSGSTHHVASSFPEIPGNSRKFPANRREEKGTEEKRIYTADVAADEPSEPANVTPIRADAHSQDAHSQPEPSASEPTPEKHHTPVNPLWDALVEVFDYSPVTPSERSKWGKIVKSLKAAHATPDDVRRAKANYEAGVNLGVYSWSLTPNALDTHLGELLKSPRASPRQNGHRPVTAATMSRPIITADDLYPD